MPPSTLVPPAFASSLPLRHVSPTIHLSHRRRHRVPLLLAISKSPATTPSPSPSSSITQLRTAVSLRRTSQIPALVRLCLSTAPLEVPLWRSAVSACISARDIDAASIVLHLGISSFPSSRLHRALLVSPLLALAKAARWTPLLSLLDTLHTRGPPAAPDTRLLVSLANVAVDARAYPASLALLSRVHKNGLQLGPVGYSVLLKSHGRAKNVREVRRAVKSATQGEIPVDSVLLNSAVDALVRCNDVRAAEALVRDKRFAPLLDVQTFNTIIKGLAQQGMIQCAFDVLEDMKSNGVTPNNVTRNTLLYGCVNAGDFDAAWRLADSVAEGAEGKSERLDEGQPPQLTIALTSLIAGLAEKGRVGDALALLADMTRRNAPPSHVTYAALISACFKRGAVQEATHVFEGIPTSELRTLDVVNAFVSGLCLVGDEMCLQQAARVVDGLLRKDQCDGSLAVKPSAETFNALLDGFMRAGMYGRAEHFLNEMDVQGCHPTIVSFTIMMKGYADGRMFRRAKQMFQEISRRGIEPDRVALAAFVNTCARSGDTSSALRVLEYMEKKGGAVSPGAHSYTPLIIAYLKAPDVEKALDMYARMRKNQVPLNVYLVQLMTAHTVKLGTAILKGEKSDMSMDAVAISGANLLRDAHEDGVDVKVLRKCRRQMLGIFMKSRFRRHLRGLDYPEMRSASEKIFEKHGWNDIDSGWRVI